MWTRLAGNNKPFASNHVVISVKETPSMRIMKALSYDGADMLAEGDRDQQKKAKLDAVIRNMGNKASYTTKYKRSIYDGVSLGRFWADGGLAPMDKRVVSTILGTTHVEVDISNCNPSLAIQLFPDMELPAIAGYVADRDYIISRLSMEFNFPPSVIKKAFLRILTNGNRWRVGGFPGIDDMATRQNFMDHEIVQAFASDSIKLHAAVDANYQWLYRVRDNSRSCMSYVLQDIESHILEIADGLIKSYDKSAFVLYKFDGYVVPRALSDRLLDELPRVVESRMSFTIKLATKELGPSFPVGFGQDELMEDGQYGTWKNQFEEQYFFVAGGPHYARISPLDGSVEFLKEAEFNLSVKKQPSDFIKRWVTDPNQRSYERIDSIPPPNECSDMVFNQWKGLAAENYDPVPDDLVDGMVEPVLQIVDVLTGGGRGPYFEWFLDWMALTVKEPGTNPKIVPCILSTEGTGKDALITKLLGSRVIGNTYYSTVPSVVSLFTQSGALHPEISSNVLVVVNEAKKTDNFQQQERMRNLVTADSHKVKKLYYNEFTSTVYMSIIMFSNRYNSMPTGRRYVAFMAEPSHVWADGFWVDFLDKVDGDEMPRAFYQYLLRRDVSVKSLLATKPTTEMDNDLRGSNGNYFELWIQDLVETPGINNLYRMTVTEARGAYNTFVLGRAMPGLVCQNMPTFNIMVREFNGKVSAGYKETIFESGGRPLTMKTAMETTRLLGTWWFRIDTAWVKKYFNSDSNVPEATTGLAPGFVPGRS